MDRHIAKVIALASSCFALDLTSFTTDEIMRFVEMITEALGSRTDDLARLTIRIVPSGVESI